MADVRSLLRQERASRQQATRPARQSAAPTGASTSKKRKAAEFSLEERKKPKTGGAQDVSTGVAAEEDALVEETVQATAQADADGDAHMRTQSPAPQPPEPEPQQPQPVPDQDDADLDAFMKEIDEAPQPQGGAFDRHTGAVIEAAPMTAAEIAAQAREEHSAQRGRKEEELEAEKEEAAQHLQDEFDEMEELEERVRKLREKREALRKAQVQSSTADIELLDPKPVGIANEESESDDEDWDDWTFRPA